MKRPLGWWDTGTSRTHTKRCTNERERILATLATLKELPEYGVVSGFTHEILNLAAAESGAGQEEKAKQLQKNLHRALKKLTKDAPAPPPATWLAWLEEPR